MAALASFRRIKEYVPVSLNGVWLIQLNAFKDCLQKKGYSDQFLGILYQESSSASAELSAGTSCLRENTFTQHPRHTSTPPDTDATFHDASQYPMSTHGSPGGDPSGDGITSRY
eukprot:s3375_g1.t1